LLLLDEPLGSLDRALRERLLNELRSILRQAESVSDRAGGITAVYVTHDQAEAFAVADRVVVMNDGCIEQDATPVNLYRHPASPFVARFIGMDNLFEAEIISSAPLTVRTRLGELRVADLPSGLASSANLTSIQSSILLIRPEAGHVMAPEEKSVNEVQGRVVACSFRGRYQQGTIAVAEEELLRLEFEIDEPLPPVGEVVRLALDPDNLSLLRGDG
jgi:ABC-type Fe3+/spermidine/putrescine transport system ATPase subunit